MGKGKYFFIMEFNKKRMLRLLFACGFMMSPLIAHAYAEPKVVVSTFAGSSFEFYISAKPRITYQDNLLVIVSDKDGSVSLEAADVKEFRFCSSDETGVAAVKSDGRFGSMMSGLKAGSRVAVLSLDANTVQTVYAGSDGKAEINFGQLPDGVYIIKTEKGSFKIKK